MINAKEVATQIRGLKVLRIDDIDLADTGLSKLINDRTAQRTGTKDDNVPSLAHWDFGELIPSSSPRCIHSDHIERLRLSQRSISSLALLVPSRHGWPAREKESKAVAIVTQEHESMQGASPAIARCPQPAPLAWRKTTCEDMVQILNTLRPSPRRQSVSNRYIGHQNLHLLLCPYSQRFSDATNNSVVACISYYDDPAWQQQRTLDQSRR
ncbi:MAG: hypothetical protein MZU95_16410 [Desulfomicrobium escambiense]|nr:hypothetical protein [Desulfomicrobium escambiense]